MTTRQKCKFTDDVIKPFVITQKKLTSTEIIYSKFYSGMEIFWILHFLSMLVVRDAFSCS